jgi:hypothetical protein
MHRIWGPTGFAHPIRFARWGSQRCGSGQGKFLMGVDQPKMTVMGVRFDQRTTVESRRTRVLGGSFPSVANISTLLIETHHVDRNSSASSKKSQICEEMEDTNEGDLKSRKGGRGRSPDEVACGEGDASPALWVPHLSVPANEGPGRVVVRRDMAPGVCTALLDMMGWPDAAPKFDSDGQELSPDLVQEVAIELECISVRRPRGQATRRCPSDCAVRWMTREPAPPCAEMR